MLCSSTSMEGGDCFQHCLQGTREEAGDQIGGDCNDPGKGHICLGPGGHGAGDEGSWICVHAEVRTKGSTDDSDVGCEEESGII